MTGRTDRSVVICAGASSLLGSAIVTVLESAGRRVVHDALRGAPDLLDPTAVEAWVAETVNREGRLDAVVFAAEADAPGSVDQVPLDAWWHAFDTRVSGAFHLVRSAAGRLTRPGGAIVLVTSEWGVSGQAGESANSAAAAGLIGLTKALARELGPELRTNAIAPGPLPAAGIDAGTYPGVPLSAIRRPSAATIAESVAFLLSAGGTAYNGQVLHPNGGATLA